MCLIARLFGNSERKKIVIKNNVRTAAGLRKFYYFRKTRIRGAWPLPEETEEASTK
jgi:hypothetical protein